MGIALYRHWSPANRLYSIWSLANWPMAASAVAERVRGLWSMTVIPNVVPYDVKTNEHVWRLIRDLDSFGNAHHQFPDNEAALPASAGTRSPYYEHGRQLPFRYVVNTGANGPLLTDAGDRPGTIFYAISTDLQDVWITATRLDSGHAVGHHVEFMPYLGGTTDHRFIHLRVGHWIVD